MPNKKYSIKDAEWILSQNLNQKLVIFLDTFVWSKLVTEHNGSYKTLKGLLQRLVEEEKVHVAIYMGSVWEVGMRDDKKQFKEIIDLMEKLSSGVFLKHFGLTFDDELREEFSAKLQGTGSKLIDRNLVFGPFWEFAQNLSVEMPKWFEDIDDSGKKDFLDQLKSKIYAVRLSDFDFPKVFGEVGSQFKSNIEQSLKKRYESTIPKMLFKDILAEEQKAFGNTFLLNIAKGLVKIAKNDLLKDKISKFSKNDYVNCVHLCPTFYCYTHLQARLRFHKDKNKLLKANHAYDVIHLGVVIPYVDWLLCDKEMATMIKETKLDERFSTKIYTEKDIADMILELEQKFPLKK